MGQLAQTQLSRAAGMDAQRDLSAKGMADPAAWYWWWDRMTAVPVCDDGRIEEPFLHFAVGTYRETLWKWFEAQHSGFIVGEVTQGIRRTSAPVKEVWRKRKWTGRGGPSKWALEC